MRYLSVCSGIEAATQAWHPLGWEPAAFSEIEKFPSAVLAHHYPDIENFGDMTKYKEWNLDGTIDLLVGGTPCQSFSVAGLRKGLADPRGNLALVFLGLLDQLRPRWVVWENVPGVLSSNGGRDFGAFLGGLAQLGYGFAYRVLDAQYVRVQSHPRAVPQRRRRVFVVGHLGDWRHAAAVLFERESLSGHPPPSRKAGEEVAGTFTARAKSGGWGQDPNLAAGGYMRPVPEVASGVTTGPPFSRTGNERIECEAIVPAVSNSIMSRDYKGPNAEGGEGAPAIPWPKPVAPTLNAAYASKQGLEDQNALGGGGMFVSGTGVRRLTPEECERLQGFPSGFTRIPWRGKDPENCPDGPRYKALGNSMAVNVMAWIGERIDQVEKKVNPESYKC